MKVLNDDGDDGDGYGVDIFSCLSIPPSLTFSLPPSLPPSYPFFNHLYLSILTRPNSSHILHPYNPYSRYPARARFDRARDRYISAKGYEILRLQLIGRSIDDLVSQIKDRVEEKTEQMADREIQQIYAVDASTLYTPEAARKVYSPRKNIKSE